MDNNIVGKTLISDNLCSSIDSFWTIVDDVILINPFDFVCVPNVNSTKTIGIVKELHRRYLFLDKRFEDFYFSKYNKIEENNNVVGSAVTVAKIDVIATIANDKNINNGYERLYDKNTNNTFISNMPVKEGNSVVFATSNEVMASLGIPKMENPIPAGIIEMTNGTKIPVDLDISYIFGPDTTHVNASGISGNMKTGYLLFLLHSIYQRLYKKGVALIIFNTKEKNMLSIDIPNENCTDRDYDLLDCLGLKACPFKNVSYYLPRGKDGKPMSSFLPQNNYKTFSYELKDIYDKLDLLFSSEIADDPKYNIYSIINYIYEAWPLYNDKNQEVLTWTDLINFEEYPKEIVTHKSTLLKFRGSLQRFRKPSTLLSDKKNTSIYLGDEIKNIKKNDIFVIDIASLHSTEEQALVIGDVLKNLNDLYSIGYAPPSSKYHINENTSRHNTNNRPEYVCILLDEINRFIPHNDHLGKYSGPLSSNRTGVAQEILKTLIAGKSRHIILLSAQQFKSQVESFLNDNTGLHLITKLGVSELSNSQYSMIDSTTKSAITKLHKGEIVLIHPAFRHPIKIVIPGPTFRKL